jgi:Flp pilus assembly protein protease CpaA
MDLLTLKITFVLGCLVIAALSDYYTLHVSNKLWLWMLPFGIAFFIAETTSLHDVIVRLAIFNFCALVAAFFYWCKWWAGADAKGIMTLGLFFPYVWLFDFPIVYWIIVSSQIILTLVYWRDLPKYIFGGTIPERPYFPSLLLGAFIVFVSYAADFYPF